MKRYLTPLMILFAIPAPAMAANACIPVSPRNPAPTGGGTGIANSLENPACRKILADAEFIGFEPGILRPNE